MSSRPFHLWPCAQVPKDHTDALLLPLAEFPHRGHPEHGQVPEPVPGYLVLQWGHCLLECQHIKAHLEFQCLQEPLAFTAKEGTVMPWGFANFQCARVPFHVLVWAVSQNQGRWREHPGSGGRDGSCILVGWGLVAGRVDGRAWITCHRLGAKRKSKEFFYTCSCSEVMVGISCRS